MASSDTKIQNLLLRAGVDHQEIAKSLADLRALTTATSETQSAFEKFSAAGAKSADAATLRMEKLRQEVVKAKSEMQSGASAAASLRDEFVRANGGANPPARAGSESFRAAGGAINQLTGTRAGDALVRAGDIAELQRRSGEISMAISGMSTSFQALPGIFGTISTASAALAAPLGATAAGLAAVAAPILAIAAPIGVVAIAWKSLDGTIESGRENVRQAMLSNQAYYEAIKLGSRDAIQSAIEDRQERLRLEQAQLADLKAARQNAFNAAKQETGGDLGGRLAVSVLEGKGAFEDIDRTIKELEKSTSTTRAELDGYNRALISQSVALKSVDAERSKELDQYIKDQADIRAAADESAASVRQRIADTVAAQNDLTVKQSRLFGELFNRQLEINAGTAPKGSDANIKKELEDTTVQIDNLGHTIDLLRGIILPASIAEDERKRRIQAATEALNDQISATKELITVNQNIAKLTQDRNRQIEDEQRAEVRARSETLLKIGIAAAKAAEAEEAYQKKLSDIRDETRKREGELTANYAKGQQQALSRYNDARAALENNYTKSSLRRLEEFRKQEEKLDADYAKRRRRAQEDLQDDLFNLARAGDVLGFITRQQSGEKDLRRMAEDADDATKERAASFAEQSELAREAYKDQLDALKVNFEKDKEERQQAYREQLRDLQRQSQERLDQEREAHEKRISQSQRLEKEFADWQAAQDAYEKELRKQREAEDFSTRLLAETNRRDELLRVSSGLWNGIESQINNLRARITPIFSALLPGLSNQSSGDTNSVRRSGARGAINFIDGDHAGGLARVPFDGYIARLHEDEVILNPNQGRQWRSGGDGSLHFAPSINIGAGNNVTRAEVEAILNDAFDEMTSMVMPMITGPAN